ncbi:MAG: class I SAM-dependent methyltransferase [Aggregatilineales bacterium]
MSATTQVTRSKHQVETALDPAVREADPSVHGIIQDAVLQLAQVRQTKGGKKDYDLMVVLYFSDMLPVLREASRVIRAGGHFYLVLGDSAPYGVHIPTDELIGRLGVAVGFSNYIYHPFRARGGKWKANPQRHTVPLREGLVILTK